MIFNYYINDQKNIKEFLNSFYISKSKIYKLFLDNNILLNNHKCNIEDNLKKGDIISIIQNEEIDYSIGNLDIKILYQDDYLLIIDKPKNISIYEGKNKNNSLANMVAKYYLDNNISLNIRFIHRLDIDTTGIIIFVKDLLSYSYMNHIIENHTLKRYYRLIVEGKLKIKKGTINMPISKNRHNDSMIINKNGDKAITNYKVLKEYKNYSYLECILETGRRHQIRCHMSYLGHPILGDILYNSKYNDSRVLLHSYKVEFIHPVYKERIEIISEIPSDFRELL